MAQEKFIIEIRTKGFQRSKKSLDQVTKSTRAFSREANRGSGVAATFRRQMSGLRNNLLLVSFAFGTVAMAFKKFVDASSGFQNVKTRLVGLMGSTERAERAFKNFNEVAATTPFSLQDVVEAGAQLKAFGADAEGMIKPVTDLAAFMGTTATEAANSLGRAFAGGAGAADILRERGILNLVKSFKGIDDLSKVTLPEFRKALEETLINPAAGIAGSTDRMAQTFTGAFSNMGDSVTRLAAEVGDLFLPTLTDMTRAIGASSDALREFIQFAKNGRPDWDVFGESVDSFKVKVETLTVDQLNEELTTLKTALDNAKEPLQEDAKAVGDMKMQITGIVQPVNKLNDGVITITELTDEFSGKLEHQGVTLMETANIFDGLANVEQNFTQTQVATTLSTEQLEAKIKVLNDELERRAAINPDLEQAQSVFKELLEDTDMAQRNQIQSTMQLIEANRDQLGTTAEVNAVLTMLQEQYDKLDPAVQAAIQKQKDLAKEQKELNNQARTAAAVITGVAGAMNLMRDSSASAEDKMKGLLTTVGALLMQLGGPGGMVGGAGLQAFASFIGHTGGLIQNNGIQRFATGGMVQGQDNVPIMAQAGEFIMQRSAVSNIGLQNLAQMNQTGQPSGGVTINIAGDMVGDEEHVRTKVLPAIKEELRREANA